MAIAKLLIAVVALSSLDIASALTCYQCSTEVDGEECFVADSAESSLVPIICGNAYDNTCYKITTTMELPNDGPQDRLKDNKKFTTMSRGCATKEDWEHFAMVDRKCDEESIGGGGKQERCICAGNGCNTGSQMTGELVLAFLLAAATLFA